MVVRYVVTLWHICDCHHGWRNRCSVECQGLATLLKALRGLGSSQRTLCSKEGCSSSRQPLRISTTRRVIDGILPALVQRVVSVQARDYLSRTELRLCANNVRLLELVPVHDL